MTDADKLMNPEIRIRIPDHFWLTLDALAEVYVRWAQFYLLLVYIIILLLSSNVLQQLLYATSFIGLPVSETSSRGY